jgi:superfamily II DNA/RNA helicase
MNNNTQEQNMETTEYYQNIEYKNFEDMEFLLEDEGNLIKGIFAYGFERPSPIQSKAIKAINDKRDLIAQSQSGTGKTGAFTIGGLSLIDNKKAQPQMIIITNTRDLARQNYNVALELSKFMEIKISLCVGGIIESKPETNYNEAITSHVLIGTPGRIYDLFKRDAKNKKITKELKIVILDEADLLLRDENMKHKETFLDTIKNLISLLPMATQICIFSATFTDKTLAITNNFMNDPVKILVNQEKVSLDLIKHYWVNVVEEKNKLSTLMDLYQKINICQVVIFVNSIEKTERLKYDLEKMGHLVDIMHSKLSDTDRTNILKDFRNMKTRILIATDLISRGIDVEQVGLVINYDITSNPDEYIHRVGRSGRFGKTGVAINFVSTSIRSDCDKMNKIEYEYKITINELEDLDKVNSYLSGSL